jgi:hypothetical protein
MKRSIIYGVIVLMLVSIPAKAQDSTNSAKLDSLILYQKIMLDQQEKIYDELVRYREPLANKKFGIEFNPAYMIASISRSYFVFSGGISLFSIDRKAEIALPIFFQNGKNNGGDFTEWDQDLIYRRFLSRHQDGFYFEGGVRYTHIREPYENWYYYDGYNYRPSSSVNTTDKLGMMFGLGYRYFSTSGLYWGISIKYGAYFGHDDHHYDGVLLLANDSKTILDIEILKFGYAF